MGIPNGKRPDPFPMMDAITVQVGHTLSTLYVVKQSTAKARRGIPYERRHICALFSLMEKKRNMRYCSRGDN